jgi:hypothetical protein
VVCVLGGTPADLAGWVPFTLGSEVQSVRRVELPEVPAERHGVRSLRNGTASVPYLRGLSAADLEWEPALEAPVLTALPRAEEQVGRHPLVAATTPAVFAAVPVGKGHVLFWQALPPGEAWSKIENRKSKIELPISNFPSPISKLTRCVSQLLTNLGVPLRLPGLRLFSNEACLNNRQPGGQWVVPLQEWQFRTDPLSLGQGEGWFQPDYDASGWPVLRAGESWESQGITQPHPTILHEDPAEQAQQYDGLAWYRVRCVVPAAMSGREVHLQIGAVNDYDWLYANGREITLTGGSRWEGVALPTRPGTARDYLLPPDALRFGAENVLVLRVFNSHGPGGLTRGPVQLVAVGATAPSPYVGE